MWPLFAYALIASPTITSTGRSARRGWPKLACHSGRQSFRRTITRTSRMQCGTTPRMLKQKCGKVDLVFPLDVLYLTGQTGFDRSNHFSRDLVIFHSRLPVTGAGLNNQCHAFFKRRKQPPNPGGSLRQRTSRDIIILRNRLFLLEKDGRTRAASQNVKNLGILCGMNTGRDWECSPILIPVNGDDRSHHGMLAKIWLNLKERKRD